MTNGFPPVRLASDRGWRRDSPDLEEGFPSFGSTHHRSRGHLSLEQCPLSDIHAATGYYLIHDGVPNPVIVVWSANDSATDDEPTGGPVISFEVNWPPRKMAGLPVISREVQFSPQTKEKDGEWWKYTTGHHEVMQEQKPEE